MLATGFALTLKSSLILQTSLDALQILYVQGFVVRPVMELMMR